MDPHSSTVNLNDSLLFLEFEFLSGMPTSLSLIRAQPTSLLLHPCVFPHPLVSCHTGLPSSLLIYQLTSGPLHLLVPIWEALPPDPSGTGSLSCRSLAYMSPSQGAPPHSFPIISKLYCLQSTESFSDIFWFIHLRSVSPNWNVSSIKAGTLSCLLFFHLDLSLAHKKSSNIY